MEFYKTIAEISEGIFKDRGSKFLAFAFPVENENEIQQHLESIKKKYFDARHHCFAYRLGTRNVVERWNDDGEPNSSAGKPILNQISIRQLTQTLVVVVRYFGGTLLGVGGLINAYKEAANDALNMAKMVENEFFSTIEINTDFENMGRLLSWISDRNLKIANQTYDLGCTIEIVCKSAKIFEYEKQLELMKFQFSSKSKN